MKLLEGGLGCFRFQRNGNDRRLGSKIFQVRVQHSEQRFDVIRRLGNLESVDVIALVAECDLELQLADDEMNRVEPHRKLLKKPAEHEEERLARLNLRFEFEGLLERFTDRDEFQ